MIQRLHDMLARSTTAPARTCGVLGLLVAFTWIASTSTAQASCGDYVVIGNPRLQSEQQHMQQPSTGMAAEMPMRHSPRPCHGPGCQQDNAFPPQPVPTVITLSPELSAIVSSGETCAKSNALSWVSVRACLPIEGVADRVERPPRDAAKTILGSRRLSA